MYVVVSTGNGSVVRAYSKYPRHCQACLRTERCKRSRSSVTCKYEYISSGDGLCRRAEDKAWHGAAWNTHISPGHLQRKHITNQRGHVESKILEPHACLVPHDMLTVTAEASETISTGTLHVEYPEYMLHCIYGRSFRDACRPSRCPHHTGHCPPFLPYPTHLDCGVHTPC